jgi:hypothetical protein
MDDPDRCAHENCGCPRPGDDLPYCGPYCANAAEGESLPGEAELEGACACGHEACQVETPGPEGPGTVTSVGSA